MGFFNVSDKAKTVMMLSLLLDEGQYFYDEKSDEVWRWHDMTQGIKVVFTFGEFISYCWETAAVGDAYPPEVL